MGPIYRVEKESEGKGVLGGFTWWVLEEHTDFYFSDKSFGDFGRTRQ